MVGTAVGHNSQDWESVAVDDMMYFDKVYSQSQDGHISRPHDLVGSTMQHAVGHMMRVLLLLVGKVQGHKIWGHYSRSHDILGTGVGHMLQYCLQ